MTLEIENYNGIQALDGVQFIQTVLGTGVVSGVEVTPDTESSDLTYDISAGECWLSETSLSVSAQSVTIPDGDIDWPRKDVLYVSGSSNIQSKQGTPRDPKPEGSVGSKTKRPETPEFDTGEGVPIAEIWVPSGESDVSQTIIRDRRLPPWAESVLTTEFEVLEAGSNETITGNWTFSAETTFDESILGPGANVVYDATGERIGSSQVKTASVENNAITGAKLSSSSVTTDKMADATVTDQELDTGSVAVTALSPKTVELDSSTSPDNKYSDAFFVPAGKTATLFAWGKQLLDGTNDTAVELRLLNPSGTTIHSYTGEHEENANGIAGYTNSGTGLEVVTVEVINTGTTVYTGDSSAADGVRFAHSVRVIE